MGIARWTLPVALAGVAAGILVHDLGVVPAPATLGIAGAAAVLVGVASGRRGAIVALTGVLVLAAGLGAWRHAASIEHPAGRLVVADLVDGQEHDLTGTVTDDPRPRADRIQVVLGDVVVVHAGRAQPVADRLLVWLPRGIDARSGDRLRVQARIDLAEDFDGFAYREYLARQGVGGIVRARRAEVVAEASGPAALLAGLRSTLLGGLTAVVPEPEAALGAGILLGVRASIAPEVNASFATAGLTHVVAISGWNIAIVVALVGAALRPLERRPGGRWTTAAVATGSVAGYVMLTGASPSVVRAALMAGALLIGRFSGSRAHASSALGLAALVMLVAAPAVLWDVGFQLSLLATAGLIWFGRSIERRLERWPGWIREPVSLTLAAQLTTLPVVLLHFERLSLVAPLANVLVVPIVPLVMLFSAIASVLGLLAESLGATLGGHVIGWLAGGPAWLLLRTMIAIGHVAAQLPGAAVEMSVPAPLAAAWLPILGLASWALRDDAAADPADDRAVPDEAMTGALAGLARLFRPLPAIATMLAILLVITLASRPDGRIRVTTLDIGQGDAILVETPLGATMLVDGGPDPELTLRRLGANLPFASRRIDLLVLSHPHQDHVAGLVEVLDRFRVRAILHADIPFENAAYDRLLTDARAAAVPIIEARAGQRLWLDPTVSIEVVYPSDADAAAPLPDGDINNGSVVLLLRHGGFSALLTGDAEAPVEAALVARGVLAPVDLLKVGHHGSKSSTTPELLDVTRPTAAVISSGEGNEYGHPAPVTVEALAARPGLLILRTDLHGDVEVESDGRSYRVRGSGVTVEARGVHGHADPGSIGRWPSPTETPLDACWRTPACRTASSFIPRASPAWRWPPPGSWRRPASRSTRGSWRPLPCSTTSTRSRSGGPAVSTASPARVASRRRVTRSSRCRSPPTRSCACSTTTGSRSAGRRCSSPWPTATWRRSSSPSTSGSTT
jgi:competence protein ComEC